MSSPGARSARGLLAFALLVAVASPAWAQSSTAPNPWRPPGVDSLRMWADEGLALLAPTRADTAGPTELAAFDHFDRIASRYFERLGPRRMAGARGVIGLLDTLGVKAEFAQDAELPQFCALTFFHPAYDGYTALTYLYWFRGDELRRQRTMLTGGKKLQFETWWTGDPNGPYETAIVDYRRTGETREPFFTLFRLTPRADGWLVLQSGRRDVDLGGRGQARFVDLNSDNVPELVSWTEGTPDPRFVAGPDLPPLLSERTWQRSDSGFVLLDRRTVPSPFATFVLFLRALDSGQAALARELAASAAVVTRAKTLGLSTAAAHVAGSWEALGTGPLPPGVRLDDRWQRDMRFAWGSAKERTKRLEVRMKFADGRWLVEKLEAPANLSPAKPAGGSSGGAR